MSSRPAARADVADVFGELTDPYPERNIVVLDTIPTRTPPPAAQPLRALAAANTRRMTVAELKRRLRRRELELCELLLDPPPDVRGYLLFEVLLWAPGFGRDRLRALNARALQRAELNLAKPVGALTGRQRRWLANQLSATR